ncbi:RluA family pseudouridine synthase [Alishewanella sp. 16-MA]|uniref:RluA family pseudouridine synthase n=1 Tax=Alishewanella maricola TaxID=2795740 RepID=A0ABS8C1E2_9ALTE|nr:RluA family pseudouridine synthase [Alishewanella maricola]MCB5225945.1 RluA family pseudouridine synthase [Alishewanella maricola]
MSNSASLTDSLMDHFVAKPCAASVDILYQDADMLVINKPSGLLSLSGKNPLNWDSVHYRLVNGQQDISPAFAQAKLPHRLDYGTSGIMLVGLTEQATQHLNRQFQIRAVQKRYLAMLDGWLTADEGMISAAIVKDKHGFGRVRICADTGMAALSQFRVLKRLNDPPRSLVAFTPHTGRTHQLRIHSQSIGHPILGCDLYHNTQSHQMAERLLLHASDIDFEHPTRLQPMHWHCPSPF